MVAFISDYGSDSVHIARVKAALQSKAVDVVDITHTIHQDDINEAAYVYGLVKNNLPEQAVVLIAVDFATRAEATEIVGVVDNNRILISYNSGVLSLCTNAKPEDYYKLGDADGFHIDAVADDMAPLVAEVSKAGSLDQFPKLTDKLHIKTAQTPVLDETRLVGTVMYIDSRGICHTNILKSRFESFVDGSIFDIQLSRHERMSTVSRKVSKTNGGSTTCFFNSADCLAIEVSRGNAERLYGLHRGRNIIVERR